MLLLPAVTCARREYSAETPETSVTLGEEAIALASSKVKVVALPAPP